VSDGRLLADLRADDPQRRRSALERMAAADHVDTETIDAVVVCLATPPKAVQRGAADLLARVAASDRGLVVDRLRAALIGAEPAFRWGAAYALGRLGLVERAMIPTLVEALGAGDGDRRWAAADLLITCARAHHDDVLDAMLAATEDPEPDRRKMALYVLRDVAPAEPGIHATTVRALGDATVGVRLAALAMLVRLERREPDAWRIVAGLVRDDPDPGVRRAALAALGTVGRGVSAVDAVLANAEASDDPALRRAAALARRRLVR
jgi:HEAT repeat protein